MNNLKRKLCGHCNQYVNSRTYRLHFSLYYDLSSKKWRPNDESHKTDLSSDSSDEDVSFNVFDQLDDSRDINDESTLEDVHSANANSTEDCVIEGTIVNDLNDEDAKLTGTYASERNNSEWIYMERNPNDVRFELWELDENDLNLDFDEDNNDAASNLYHEVQDEKLQHIVKWMVIFLCMWSSYCCISDIAIDILVQFLHAVFQSIGTVIPALTGLAFIFPKSLNLMKRQLGLDKDKFKKYVVCKKCESLYEFEDCYFEQFGQTVIRTCSHVAHPNHRQAFRRNACGEPLLKEVLLRNGKKRLYPFKVYCYNSIINSLQNIISRPGLVDSCEQWRKRNIPSGILADVFDGRIWKDFMYVDNKPFLASPKNYALMLNVDWFQPFKHSIYSVGALYMVIMNLPREQRFKPENAILVGIIPGPHEPKLTINSYLKPLVDELNILWNEGIEVTYPGCSSRSTFHAALLCVGCDVPAARKVCGFTGHASCNGCSKCKKQFAGNVSDRMDFSGFEICPPRSNQEHRQQAQEILNQTSATDQAQKEKESGTRFTELMMLTYFDCVRFHIIDPMHNLFTGTAKHVMKNIWLDDENNVINPKRLVDIQKKIDDVMVPSNVGRLPKKIANSYGGFTADQWKSWTLIYSVFALWNILPEEDLDTWREFVIACSILCSTVITETKAKLGHLHLMNFCKSFEQLYGKCKVTPNMHLHMHILDCILDYGPVYSFWLFSFERYNGILGEYSTNQRSVEIQIMRKFMCEQFVKHLSLPTQFKEHFDPVFKRLRIKEKGTLQEYSSTSSLDNSKALIQLNHLSIGPVRKGLHWTITESISSLLSIISPISKFCLETPFVPCLKKAYKTMFNGLDESSVTGNCERISGIAYGGEEIGSNETRKERSAFILARWCSDSLGQIDESGLNLRPGLVNFFIRQNIKLHDEYHTCVLASVKWFKKHPARMQLGQPLEVWCKDLFEDEGPAEFIPFQRIFSKFVPAFDIVQRENVLVVCPLQRKVQC